MKEKPNKKIIRSIVNYLYLYPFSRLKEKPSIPDVKASQSTDTKVAFICDEMTWVDYSGFVTAVFLHPKTWKEQLTLFSPYSEIPDLCKKYEYAINVNTVTESETMFSRRLLQMTMCGITVISNDSVR